MEDLHHYYKNPYNFPEKHGILSRLCFSLSFWWKHKFLHCNVIIFPNSSPTSQTLHHSNVFPRLVTLEFSIARSPLSIIIHLLIILIHWNSVQRGIFTLSSTRKDDIPVVSGNFIIACFRLRLQLAESRWGKVLCAYACTPSSVSKQKVKKKKQQTQQDPSQILPPSVRNYLKLKLFDLVHSFEEC